eukprot:3941583-Rhodomonas_salina.2
MSVPVARRSIQNTRTRPGSVCTGPLTVVGSPKTARSSSLSWSNPLSGRSNSPCIRYLSTGLCIALPPAYAISVPHIGIALHSIRHTLYQYRKSPNKRPRHSISVPDIARREIAELVLQSA